MKTQFNKRIGWRLLVGLLAVCCSTNVFSAETRGECGENVKWSLVDGELTISGSGPMQDFVKGKRPWKSSKIKTVIIKPGVTSIGDRAFENYAQLKEVVIPQSVVTIGDSAFMSCNNLKKIVIPNSVTSIGKRCFSDCFNLGSVKMSNHLQSIGERAFDWCYAMTDIILPNSVRIVGGGVFRECHALTILIVPDEPFEVQGKDSTLGLKDSPGLSMVRGNTTLCPDYIKKYLPKECPFLREGNPRQYYTGSISKDSVIIIPAMKSYTFEEALDTIEDMFHQSFSVTYPCNTYETMEEQISQFIINLERPIYKDILQHYYDRFYEAGSNNELDAATELAFKYILLGGKEDEELMWDIILTKYGSENSTNNMRVLMRKFTEISDMKERVYQYTIDSITAVYSDVIYPPTLREMCGYWVSVSDTTQDGSLADAPEFIFNIEDITCANGTTLLSAPKCHWSSKKKKGNWQYNTNDRAQLRYSYETNYNEETQTLQLLFSSQSKKIANTKMQHMTLDMVQQLEATMSASVESYQKELNRALAKNLLDFGGFAAGSAAGFGIGLGIRLVAAAVTFAVIYASNIEKAETYDIRLTPQAPEVMDVSVKYAFSEHNYNNGKEKYKEDVKKLTFVKWNEADSVVFLSKKWQPIFVGKEIPANSPMLEAFNAKKTKETYRDVNKSNLDKLRQKANRMLQMRERKESALIESSEKAADQEVMFY